MKKTPEAVKYGFTLEDQEILKGLGISCMSSGLEYALRQKASFKESLERVNQRAEALRPLSINDDTLEKISKDTGRPVDELRNDLWLFRDVNQAPPEGDK